MSKEEAKTKKIYKVIEKVLNDLNVDFVKREEYYGFEYNIEERDCIVSYFIDVVQDNNYIEFSSIHIVPEEKKDYVKGLIAVNECNKRIIHGGFFLSTVEENMSIEYFNAIPYIDSDISSEDITMLVRMSYISCSNCIDAIDSFMNNEMDVDGFVTLIDVRLE